MKVLSLNRAHFLLSSGRLGMELWDRAAQFWHPLGESMAQAEQFHRGCPRISTSAASSLQGNPWPWCCGYGSCPGLWGCSPPGRTWIQPACAHLRVLMPAPSSAACNLERDRPGKCCSWAVRNSFPRQEGVNEGRRRQSFW